MHIRVDFPLIRAATDFTPVLQQKVIPPENAGPQMHFIHTDHLGTPVLMTDMNQQVVLERQQTRVAQWHLLY